MESNNDLTLKKENGVYYLYTKEHCKKISVYDDFKDNKTNGVKIEKSKNNTTYYVGVEKDESVENINNICYKVREIYDIYNDDRKLIDVQENLKASQIEIYLDNYKYIKKNLNVDKFKYKDYFQVQFRDESIVMIFDKPNRYKNLIKHVHILNCFMKFMLGIDIVIFKLEYFVKSKKLITVLYSNEIVFTKIDKSISIKEKLELIDGCIDSFFVKWMDFYTTKYIKKILYVFVNVYRAHHFRDVDWNIRNIVALMEGIYKSIKYNDRNSDLRKKISDINSYIVEEKKRKKVINNIGKIFKEKEIEEVVKIRHDLSHTNLKEKEKYIYDELLSKSMTTLELYIIYTIKDFKNNKFNKCIEKLKEKDKIQIKKYLKEGVSKVTHNI